MALIITSDGNPIKTLASCSCGVLSGNGKNVPALLKSLNNGNPACRSYIRPSMAGPKRKLRAQPGKDKLQRNRGPIGV